MTMRHVNRRSDEDNEETRKRQDREVEGSNEYIVHTRAVDHSFWLRLSYQIDKYRAILYLIVAFLISLGFNFKTPAQNYKELSVRIDTVNYRVDSMFAIYRKSSVGQDKIEAKIDVLITFKCLEGNTRDLAIAGLDCSKFTINPKVAPQ